MASPLKTPASSDAAASVASSEHETGAPWMRHRVGIAHEWLVAYGGSERCVEEMLRVFPDAQLRTTLVRDGLPEAFAHARPSLLQRIPGASAHHEWLLPLMPLSWRLQAPFDEVDAVISSSHACAKAVPVPDGVPHLCYCHAPMRYAWDFEGERHRLPRALQPVARAGAAGFRLWDRRTSARVTRFMANSRAVADRIGRFYGRRADVVHPPVRTDFFTPAGEREDFFLYVGRLVSYKRADLAVEAFADLPHRLVVVGDGHFGPRLRARATRNVTFRSSVTDGELRDLYRRARALVFPAEEDFGIAMAEAQACGTPVIGLAAGGALDIVRDGETGWLLPSQDADALRGLVRRAAAEEIDSDFVRRNALRFSSSAFRKRIAEGVEEVVHDPAPT